MGPRVDIVLLLLLLLPIAVHLNFMQGGVQGSQIRKFSGLTFKMICTRHQSLHINEIKAKKS